MPRLNQSTPVPNKRRSLARTTNLGKDETNHLAGATPVALMATLSPVASLIQMAKGREGSPALRSMPARTSPRRVSYKTIVVPGIRFTWNRHACRVWEACGHSQRTRCGRNRRIRITWGRTVLVSVEKNIKNAKEVNAPKPSWAWRMKWTRRDHQ